MKRTSFAVLGAIILLGTAIRGASAQNIVANPGFETGDLTGWTLSGNTGFTAVDPGTGHSGAFGFDAGPVGSDGFLSEVLATTAGASYTFSFWVRNDGGPTNDFSAFWNGVSIFSLINSSAFGYVLETFTEVAAGPSTTIQFDYRQDPSGWDLDDINVSSVGGTVTPEPATMTLLATGLIALTGAGIRRRRSQKK